MTGRMQVARGRRQRLQHLIHRSQMFGWSTAVIFEVLRRTMRRQFAAAPKLR